MTDEFVSPAAERYLAALDAALELVPATTRAEIVAGVREELLGLDATETAKRIAELGDPEFIAATAHAESQQFLPDAESQSIPADGAPQRAAERGTPAPGTPTAGTPSDASDDGAPHGGVSGGGASGSAAAPGAAAAFAPGDYVVAKDVTTAVEAPWFSVIATLLLMLGSFVVPLVGPLVGFIMVWISQAWTRAEKWIATLAPVAVGAAIILIAVASRLFTPRELMPGDFAGLVTWHLAAVAVFITPVAVGAWLLWRARRRQRSVQLAPASNSGRSA